MPTEDDLVESTPCEESRICDYFKLDPSSEKCNTDKTSTEFNYKRMCPVSCGACKK